MISTLLVIVPSRGRPGSLRRMVEAWSDTGAFADNAALVFAVDADDPTLRGYRSALVEVSGRFTWKRKIRLINSGKWRPMVPKLNRTSLQFAERAEALAFMGDDHVPRTVGWAGRYVDELRSIKPGIVYGNDLIHGERLPTQWAMSSEIVRELRRMVPADVEHLFCDNAVLALGRRAGCIRYVPNVIVEHVHPVAGKAAVDESYRRSNGAGQYRRDSIAYRGWLKDGLPRDAAALRGLRDW